MTQIHLIPPRVPLVDKNGLITREWYQFFYDFYLRVGGADAIDSDDVETLLATVDTQSWRSDVDALKNDVVMIAPLVPVDELRTLYQEALHQNAVSSALISQLTKRVEALEVMLCQIA